MNSSVKVLGRGLLKVNEFYYKGVIPSSKSVMNRLLICQSYSKDLRIDGDSQCDDVVLMKKALSEFDTFNMYCGSAGTVLRFLAFKASRHAGNFLLRGTDRLLSRPIDDLLFILRQLGVSASVGERGLEIASGGWLNKESRIEVPRGKSSQFLSGLLLNSWDLDRDIEFFWSGDVVSDGYLQITIDTLRSLGMALDVRKESIHVKRRQTIAVSQAEAESDLSSAFAVATMAVLGGEAHFLKFPFLSLQPDLEFVKILQAMNASLDKTKDSLSVFKTDHLRPIDWNINDCPDLFPVLAILCSAADGTSVLHGAPHLAYKESDRIGKTAELLNKMKIENEIIEGGMKIIGNRAVAQNFEFDTDEDHRLAFAAGAARLLGHRIRILHPEVVTKSFPEFWEIAEPRK
ncbi:MAG: 3-phosphoshikimate 1-carboxyvinyltransferase [Bdellovibrionales bacterium]|nr:3-phosphoshikimate 1-carboxyvinyltransferase [Bdellovibrionales bacterium]